MWFTRTPKGIKEAIASLDQQLTDMLNSPPDIREGIKPTSRELTCVELHHKARQVLHAVKELPRNIDTDGISDDLHIFTKRLKEDGFLLKADA